MLVMKAPNDVVVATLYFDGACEILGLRAVLVVLVGSADKRKGAEFCRLGVHTGRMFVLANFLNLVVMVGW